jgi:hypothetical protein
MGWCDCKTTYCLERQLDGGMFRGHTAASSSESKESFRSTRDPRGVRPRRRLADALRDSFRMLSRSVFFSFSSLSFTVPMSSLGSAMLAALGFSAQTAAGEAAEVPAACWRLPRLSDLRATEPVLAERRCIRPCSLGDRGIGSMAGACMLSTCSQWQHRIVVRVWTPII